jgi:hypothetical protein
MSMTQRNHAPNPYYSAKPERREPGRLKRGLVKAAAVAALAGAGGLAVLGVKGVEAHNANAAAHAAKERAANGLIVDKIVSPKLNEAGAYLDKIYKAHPDQFTKTTTDKGDVVIDRRVKDLNTGLIDEITVIYGADDKGAEDITNVKMLEIKEPDAGGKNYSGIVIANNAGGEYAKKTIYGSILTDSDGKPYDGGAMAGTYDTAGDYSHSGSNTYNKNQLHYNYSDSSVTETATTLADGLTNRIYVDNMDIAEPPAN